MNISPVSFGMSAVYTQKGIQQLVKASANAKKERSDNLISSAEQFNRTLENSQYVDVLVDKTGILFPRLKAQVVTKAPLKRQVLSTVKQPRLNKTSTRIFDISAQRAQNADSVISSSQIYHQQ